MSNERTVVTSSYVLSLMAAIAALVIWLPSFRGFTPNSVFPLLGLVAFGLMWAHYVSDALRRYFGVSKHALRTYFRTTSFIVLVCIILHPLLFELQLYFDGFGLPPESMFTVYATTIDRLALLAGVTALTCFLIFELHRFYSERPWWRFVSWANIVAMALILWHGFTLGSNLSDEWFQLIWLGYAVTFALSVGYSEFDKQRSSP